MQQNNYISEFLCRLLGLVQNVHSVAWVGVHPWLPVIYQFLDENGIVDFCIMDNDAEKQGKEIWSYVNSYADTKFPFKKVNVESVKKKDDSTLYLMANTHETELRIQLENLGVDSNRIVNLYDFTREKFKYDDIRKEYSKTHRQLSLKEIQGIELDLLVEFRNYCEKNNLRYYLGGGTLIGAVRHKGFIPWDDDIDVYMPYEDYIKFVKGYEDHGKYILLEWRRENDYPLQFAKLTDSTTKLFHPLGFMNAECVMSVYIDVFPISGYPNDVDEIEKKWNRNWELDAEWFYYQQIKGVEPSKYGNIRENIEYERHALSFDESEYVGNMIRTIHRPWAVKRSLYDETVKLKFEEELFDAPSGYDKYLKYRYGEYMMLPPEEKREQHLFPTYEV